MPEIVVDSSIWIDFFNKKINPATRHLSDLLMKHSSKSPVIIFPVIMQEILQGIENDKHFVFIKENLQGLTLIEFEPYEISIKAAQLYRSLRKKGITVRKPNDCLISALCIELNLSLFHNDKDFNNIADHSKLKIYKKEA